MMRRATRDDRELVVDILSRQFSIVPGTVWMLRKGRYLKDHVRTLMVLIFEKAFVKKGIYISSNQQGIALCFKYNQKVFSFRVLGLKFWFLLTAMRWRKLHKLVKIERYKEQQRPKSGEYFYFWFFAALKGRKSAGFELKNEIFKMVKEKQLPIFAETSIRRNKSVFERYGFRTFHYWEDKSENIQYWFLRYDP
jgi:hypothetical protein